MSDETTAAPDPECPVCDGSGRVEWLSGPGECFCIMSDAKREGRALPDPPLAPTPDRAAKAKRIFAIARAPSTPAEIRRALEQIEEEIG